MLKNKITVSRCAHKNWKNNAIQYPRLIGEAARLGIFDDDAVGMLASALFIHPDAVREVIQRAVDDYVFIADRIGGRKHDCV